MIKILSSIQEQQIEDYPKENYEIHIPHSFLIKMEEKEPKNDALYLLSTAIEKGDPTAAEKVREHLNKSDDPSEMRYLEGLLLLLGEQPGELEDSPDYENDPDEYWQENDYFEV